MNQIISNVQYLFNKYGKERLNNDTKLSLAYLKEFHGLKFDKNSISTQDFLGIDIRIIQSVIDAKYIIELIGEDERS